MNLRIMPNVNNPQLMGDKNTQDVGFGAYKSTHKTLNKLYKSIGADSFALYGLKNDIRCYIHIDGALSGSEIRGLAEKYPKVIYTGEDIKKIQEASNPLETAEAIAKDAIKLTAKKVNDIIASSGLSEAEKALQKARKIILEKLDMKKEDFAYKKEDFKYKS